MIEAALTLVLAAAAVYFLLVVPREGFQDQEDAEGKTRACPECTTPISVIAKRCPHCTAVVQPAPA